MASTNQLAWGELQPKDLAKRTWISNLAAKSAVKKQKEYWTLKNEVEEMKKMVAAPQRTPIILPMQTASSYK